MTELRDAAGKTVAWGKRLTAEERLGSGLSVRGGIHIAQLEAALAAPPAAGPKVQTVFGELASGGGILTLHDADGVEWVPRTEADDLRAALERIANHKHCRYDVHDPADSQEYNTGIADRHRCAAQIARTALEARDAHD